MSTHKLLAKWQGPYPVRRRVSPVTYKVDMFDKRKCRWVFHVNMLRKWYAPTALNLWAGDGSADDDADGDELLLWKDYSVEEPNEPIVSDWLSATQRRDLHKLREEFLDVMCDLPGQTNLAVHLLKTEWHTQCAYHPIVCPMRIGMLCGRSWKKCRNRALWSPP